MHADRARKAAGRWPAAAPIAAVGPVRARLPCGARRQGPPQNSLRSLRSLRSDSRGESDVEARALRALTLPAALLGAAKSLRRPPAHGFACSTEDRLDVHLGGSAK